MSYYHHFFDLYQMTWNRTEQANESYSLKEIGPTITIKKLIWNEAKLALPEEEYEILNMS